MKAELRALAAKIAAKEQAFFKRAASKMGSGTRGLGVRFLWRRFFPRHSVLQNMR